MLADSAASNGECARGDSNLVIIYIFHFKSEHYKALANELDQESEILRRPLFYGRDLF
jgi:hypothetical protein